MIPLPKLKPRNVDMSPEAIDQRLRECARLSAIEFAKNAVERERLTAEFLEQKRASAAEASATAPTQDDTPLEETDP